MIDIITTPTLHMSPILCRCVWICTKTQLLHLSPTMNKWLNQNINPAKGLIPSLARLYYNPNRICIWLQTNNQNRAQSYKELLFKVLSKLWHSQSLQDCAQQIFNMRATPCHFIFYFLFFLDLLPLVLFPPKLTISPNNKDKKNQIVGHISGKKFCFGTIEFKEVTLVCFSL